MSWPTLHLLCCQACLRRCLSHPSCMISTALHDASCMADFQIALAGSAQPGLVQIFEVSEGSLRHHCLAVKIWIDCR